MISSACHTAPVRSSTSALTLPKISVVTPSLNQGAFLERTIQSVLNQKYPQLEYFILDGGSTDNTHEILEKYQHAVAACTRAPDQGQSDAIMRGWKMATGDVLAWLNSDDFYYPDVLFQVGEKFARQPGLMLLSGTVAIVDGNERLLRLKRAPEVRPDLLLPWGDVPGQAGTFIRREAFEAVGGPRLDLHYVMDWELWLRIALRFPPESIERIDTVIAADRQWPGTKMNNAHGREAAEVRRILREHFARGELPADLQGMERRALARAWWRQSRGELKGGWRRLAFSSLCRAVGACPWEVSPLKILRHTRRIVFPTADYRRRWLDRQEARFGT